jgi:hypothetical protein
MANRQFITAGSYVGITYINQTAKRQYMLFWGYLNDTTSALAFVLALPRRIFLKR